MAPSSTTPNFSRPFPSPLSTTVLDTPVRASRRGPRRALADLPHSASQVNMPLHAQVKAPSPARKSLDVTSHNPAQDKPAEIQTGGAKNAGDASGGRHNGEPSNISLKSTTSDSSITVLRYATLFYKLLNHGLTNGQL